jgi:hypothetical protein
MATQKLLVCMQESNKKLNMHTEFLSIRLKYSDKNSFAKDLVLEWSSLTNK